MIYCIYTFYTLKASTLLSHLIRLKSYTTEDQTENNVWHNIVVQDTTSKVSFLFDKILIPFEYLKYLIPAILLS